MQDPTKKDLVFVVTSIMLLGVLLDGAAMNLLLNFFIAGVVPGTQLSVPYWAMMTIYCLAITAIATWAIELYFAYRTKHRKLPQAVDTPSSLRQAK